MAATGLKSIEWLTAAWLAQLGECLSAEREVTGSNPGRTNTMGGYSKLTNGLRAAASGAFVCCTRPSLLLTC